jgi:hypothetical protein
MCEKPENDYLKQVTSPLARQAPPWFYGAWRVRSALVWGPDWQQQEKAERASRASAHQWSTDRIGMRSNERKKGELGPRNHRGRRFPPTTMNSIPEKMCFMNLPQLLAAAFDNSIGANGP